MWYVSLLLVQVKRKYCRHFHYKNTHRETHIGDIPADTGVFRMSSGRLKKVMMSYNQTRRLHNVWQKTSDLRRLEEVLFTLSWRRSIYNALKVSLLQRLEDVGFTSLEDVRFITSWRRLFYDVLKMSHLRRLEDVRFTSLEDVRFIMSGLLKRDSNTGVFMWVFKNAYFEGHMRMATY